MHNHEKPAPVELNTAEAAARSNRAQWTVQRWIREGRLPALKVGREYRINRADLDAFLQGKLGPPGGDPLAAHIRRVLAEGGDFPEPTDDQIRLIARLLPRPAQQTIRRSDGAA